MEVVASSASSSPGALPTSMSVAEVARLTKLIIHSVKTEYQSEEENKKSSGAHPEATGTSILILGKVFRAFEGTTLGCLATFSAGSGVNV